MELDYTYWRDKKSGWLIGHLNIWPEHWTQGKDVKELEKMLADLYEFYKEEQVEKKYGKFKL
jgi:predicted RNase H-like HicB family nuclease